MANGGKASAHVLVYRFRKTWISENGRAQNTKIRDRINPKTDQKKRGESMTIETLLFLSALYCLVDWFLVRHPRG